MKNKSYKEIERSVSSIASWNHADCIAYKLYVMFNEMCTCSRTLLSRLSRISAKSKAHNDRDISRVTKSFDFFHEKMVHLNINCGRCCSRKGCLLRHYRGLYRHRRYRGREEDRVRACFNLPPR